MEPLQAPEGDVVAEHKASLTGRFAATLLLILPGVALLVLSTQLEQKDAGARIPLAFFGLLLAGLGGLGFVQQNRSRVVVRTDGVERWGLRGKLWALRWADMPEFRYKVVKLRLGGLLGLLLPALGTSLHVSVTDPEGKKRKLPTNMKAMDVLAERVTEQQTTAQFAAARAKLDAGEEVRFGKALALDKEKISVRKLFRGMRSCALPEIEKFSVDGGILRIRQRGKTFAFASIFTSAVPNVFLFLRLLDSLLGRKPPALGQDRDFTAQAWVG